MAITNQTNKIRQHCNGVTTAFSFSFKIFSASDLLVYQVDNSTGTPTLKAITTHYTVAINATTEGGVVTTVGTPWASGKDIFIKRVVSLTQPTVIPTESNFPERAIEDANDRSRMIDIQLQEIISRSGSGDILSEAVITFPSIVNGKYLGWAGGVMANLDPPVGATGATGDAGADGQNAFRGFGYGPASDYQHDIGVLAGQTMDSTGLVLLKTLSTIVKQIDAVWAAGNDAGGLDTGTIGASKCAVALWCIGNASGSLVDFIFTKSMSGPAMPTGYTKKFQIGCFMWDGTVIRNFRVSGNGSEKMLWFTTPPDVFNGSNLAGTSPTDVSFATFLDPAVAREVYINAVASISGTKLYMRPRGYGESGTQAHQVAGTVAAADTNISVSTVIGEVDSEAKMEAWVNTSSYLMYLRGYKLSL